jgi:hypothetical protein
MSGCVGDVVLVVGIVERVMMMMGLRVWMGWDGRESVDFLFRFFLFK